jgi:Co/Zn/Cd efflux system component
MIILNGIVVIAEFAKGDMTKSFAVKSDAWHTLSDQARFVIGRIALRTFEKLPTSITTFGIARIHTLEG